MSSLDNEEKVQIIKLDDGVRVVYLTLPSDDMPNREYTIFKTTDSKPLLKVVE